MSDSETSVTVRVEALVPAACQVIKEDLDKCLKEKGDEGCKELLEAFQTCLKTTAEGT